MFVELCMTLVKHKGFLKSDGKPILHHTLICKCANAHPNTSDPVSTGNARADAAAKSVSPLPPPSLPHTHNLFSVPTSLSAVQSLASPTDKRPWQAAGASFNSGLVQMTNPVCCLPFFHIMPNYHMGWTMC